MSLWKRIACNPEMEVSMKKYYNEKGLADIRIYFAQWIEERLMNDSINNASTELYGQLAHLFYEDLKQKIISLGNESFLKFKIAEICTNITQTSAVDLYSHIHHGIQTELQFIEQMPQNNYSYPGAGVGNGIDGVNVTMNGGSNSAMVVHNGGDELYTAHTLLQKLAIDIEHLKGNILSFREEYDKFHSYLSEYNQNKAIMNPQSIMENDMRLKEQFGILMGGKSGIFNDIKRIVAQYDSIQESVINELKNWQRNQALAGNGAPFRDNLDEIQRCIEMLVELVYKILGLLNNMILIQLDDNADLKDVLIHVRCAQEVLVLSAFIVEKQPPQVMKTNTRFAAAVRWLIGPQLGIHLNSPTVECVILSEAQAQRHSTQRTMADVGNTSVPASSGDIANNFGTMEYQQQTHIFSASFRNMQLRKIKRAEKKGTESVMDEKFALLFYTSSIVNDYRIRVWTLSLPVVVIVHGNQEPQSWATITWDNAFSEIVREPFLVPEKVSWSQLALALNTKFASATGRGLAQENLNFLYEKLVRSDGMNNDRKEYITWTQFCKEPLPDRSFTFWDWFFAIMKLTKDHLLNLWKAGLIIGFINKRKTIEEILRNLPIGTFLLRFSDSELGGISVAFVNKECNVMMLAPWTARDINIRGLADRIHDLDLLKNVYPTEIPRDEAFGDFYTQRIEEQTTRDGYVASTIKSHVPAIEGGSLSVTPQLQMQSPHSQDIQMTNSVPYLDEIEMYLNEKNCVAGINWNDL